MSPGAIGTPIFDVQFPDRDTRVATKAAFQQMTPLGRMGRADEMAKAISFLASEDSSYGTGTGTGIDLVADGGITQV